MEKPKKKRGLVKGLIIGGAIGSVMSLLISSKKGKKIREKFSDEIETSRKKFWSFLKKKKEEEF